MKFLTQRQTCYGFSRSLKCIQIMTGFSSSTSINLMSLFEIRSRHENSSSKKIGWSDWAVYSHILYTQFAPIFRQSVSYSPGCVVRHWTKVAEKHWRWRTEQWFKLQNTKTWGASREFWDGQVATKLELNWQKSLQKIRINLVRWPLQTRRDRSQVVGFRHLAYRCMRVVRTFQRTLN